MLFNKKNHLVGLDIGSRTLKVAEINETKKGFCLKKIGLTDIPQGCIEEGIIKEPEEIADCITQLYKAYNIKARNVAISIGGYAVIVKKITVNNMPEELLQESIYIEAEQYIPFDIDDVNIDFQILGENENNPNQINVLLVAARKEIINDYANLVRLAGLNPCLIDIDAFAVQNIYELNYGVTYKNNVLIDIGAEKTSLNILKNNSSVFMRDISFGCQQINRQIASFANCPLDEAEQIKFSRDSKKISNENLAEIVSSVISNWCTEIKLALDFYYSSYPGDQIENIAISGGGAKIDEFRSLLSSETAADTTTINPFLKLDVDDKFDSSYLEQIGPQAVICMGLATRRVDDK